MKNNSGFTLAEVLITLAIIGVVAAMTVPALMTSTRGKEYEVGATKALSTIANSITMRIALEGVAPANFEGGIGQYLLQAPGGRTGEQAALPSTSQTLDASKDKDGNVAVANTAAVSATLKDGMIVSFPAGASTATCGNAVDGCLITIDTNGVKGPTRTAAVVDEDGKLSDMICGDGDACSDKSVATPTVNVSPDIIQLRIRDTVVEPANQRTKNILATGNSMISN